MSAFSFNPFTGSFDKINGSSGGPSGPNPWSRFTGTIAGVSTVIIDTVPLTDLIGSKYIVAISDEIETNAQLVELNILNLTSTLRSSVFSKLNSNLDIEIDATINGSNMEVSVTNNEIFSVNYNVLRALFS